MITSLENKKVKEWTGLNIKKYRNDSYLLFSMELIQAAKRNGYLKTLIYTGEKPFDFEESYEVSKDVMKKISRNEDISVLGVGRKIEEKRGTGDRVLILEDLSDPLNIGRILESACLFGFDRIILSKECADLYHPKALEASRGALYDLHISFGDIRDEIYKLKEEGFTIYATGLRDNTKELYEVEEKEKMAFLMGTESSGVKEETFKICDEIVKIDMHNMDSLNVAMAASIIMYHFSKGL